MTLHIDHGVIPQELRDLILEGKCVVFIGSGPSTGYLSWPDLVNTLCERCRSTRRVSEHSPAADLLDAAQDAKESDRDAYFAFLGEHFGRPVANAPIIYDTLLLLPFACYLTVNFDPLLVLKARTSKNPCPGGVHAFPSLDRMQMHKRSIHHLHGLITEGTKPVEGAIVLARDEFDSAYRANSSLMNFLVSAIENQPILFIGCELNSTVTV